MLRAGPSSGAGAESAEFRRLPPESPRNGARRSARRRPTLSMFS